MLNYQHFLHTNFPHYFKNEEKAASPFEAFKRKAIDYLEWNCSPVYGFPGEAFEFEEDAVKTKSGKIPTAYDSALVLPLILDEGVAPSLIDSIACLLTRVRRKDVLVAYLLPEKDMDSLYFPNDIDTTSLVAAALWLTGNLTTEQCKVTANAMLEGALKDENGAIGTWLPVKNQEVLYKKHQVVPKMCAGCAINMLWFLAAIGMGDHPHVLKTVDYIDGFINTLVENKGSDEELPGMTYYTNKYVINFMLSRYLAASDYARNKFLLKFVDLLLFDLDEMVKLSPSPSAGRALDIASTLLALTQLKLHKDPENGDHWRAGITQVEPSEIRKKMCVLMSMLVELQENDGALAPFKIYRFTKFNHYGASKEVTTAFALSACSIFLREILESTND